VAFDKAGRLCTAAGDGVVRRWDVTDPAKRKLVEELPVIPPLTRAGTDLHSLILSRDGTRIYTGDRSGRIREWNDLTKEHRIIAQTNSWVQDLAITPDGSLLAAAVADGSIHILNLARDDRPQVAEFFADGTQGNTLDFSSDGRYLVVGSGDGNTRVWDVTTEMPIGFPIRIAGITRKIRFRPNTNTFAIAAGEFVEIYGFRTQQRQQVPLPRTYHEEPIAGIASLAFSPDGNRLLMVHGHEPAIIDVKRNIIQSRLANHKTEFGAAAFGSRDGETIIASAEGSVALFDSRLNRLSTTPVTGLDQPRNPDLVYEPQSGCALMASDRLVWSYRIREKKLSNVFLAKEPMRVTVLAVNPVKPEVLIAVGRMIRFFNTATETLDPVAHDAEDDVYAAAYSPDGTQILLGVRNNAAEVRRRSDWKSLFELSHNGAVVAVGWRGDGSVMVTGSRDKTVSIWDAKTGLLLGPRLRHPNPITAIAYSPTEDLIATACKSRRSATVHVFLLPIPEAKAP